VPALILDEGTVLANSALICAYLDSLHDGNKLIPTDGKARWQVLHLEGLADGLCESAIAVVRENVRPDEKQWTIFGADNGIKSNGPWGGSTNTPKSWKADCQSVMWRLAQAMALRRGMVCGIRPAPIHAGD